MCAQMTCDGDSEVLSDVEVILPWEVIETCRGLQKNGTSCFLSVNKQDCTTSQLAIQKLEDDSIKIRITVMVLGTYSEDDEERTASEMEVADNSVLEHTPTTDDPVVSDNKNSPDSPAVADSPTVGDGTPLSRKRPFKGKPRIPNAIDTSRLNKHLTAIWSSKRKKVLRKPLMVPLKNDEAKLLDSISSNDASANDSRASTVIIVKTVSRDAQASETVQQYSLALSADGGIDGIDMETKKGMHQPVVPRASHDIAERLKAKKRRFTEELQQPQRTKNEGSIVCELCGEFVVSYAELVNHVRQGHEDCTYVRTYLDEIIPLAAQLTIISLPCKACGRTFSGQAALAAHKHECHENETRETKLSAQRRRVKSELLASTKPHKSSTNGADNSAPAEPGTFVCKTCSKEFGSRLKLKRHANVHLDSQDADNSAAAEPENFICNTCNKEFDSRMKLKRHANVHLEPQFACTHCKRRFNDRDNLQKHIERLHGPNSVKKPRKSAAAKAVDGEGEKSGTAPAAVPRKKSVQPGVPRHTKPGKSPLKLKAAGSKAPSAKTSATSKAASANAGSKVGAAAEQQAGTATDQFTCNRCDAVFSRTTLLVTHMRYCRQGEVKS